LLFVKAALLRLMRRTSRPTTASSSVPPRTRNAHRTLLQVAAFKLGFLEAHFGLQRGQLTLATVGFEGSCTSSSACCCSRWKTSSESRRCSSSAAHASRWWPFFSSSRPSSSWICDIDVNAPVPLLDHQRLADEPCAFFARFSDISARPALVNATDSVVWSLTWRARGRRCAPA
jgi:hypothetical protein